MSVGVDRRPPIEIPPVAQIRERLGENYREAELLRSLLRIAERIERRDATRRPQAAPGAGRP
jgi:hypothetical protein